MLPARAILREEKGGWNFVSPRKSWQWKSLPGSRLDIYVSVSFLHRTIVNIIYPA